MIDGPRQHREAQGRVFVSKRGPDLHHESRRQIAPMETRWSEANPHELCNLIAQPPDDV